MRTKPPAELVEDRALTDAVAAYRSGCHQITAWTRRRRWWPWSRRRLAVGRWCGLHGARWTAAGCTWTEVAIRPHDTTRY